MQLCGVRVWERDSVQCGTVVVAGCTCGQARTWQAVSISAVATFVTEPCLAAFLRCSELLTEIEDDLTDYEDDVGVLPQLAAPFF